MKIDEIIKDALILCIDALKRGKHDYIIALAEARGVDFIYSNIRTPFYLEQIGVLKIFGKDEEGFRTSVFPSEVQLDPKGCFLVTINLGKAEEWVDKELKEPVNGERRHAEFPQGRDYFYENNELHLKLQDKSTCTLDLSKAPVLRPIFETFFFLYKDKPRNLFDKDELLKRYKTITGEEIDWRTFIKRKSSIYGKMIYEKECLKNRIVWEYDKKEKKYRFQILALSDR